MKKSVIFLVIILLIIVIICVFGIKSNILESRLVKKQNKEYEQYLENEIYGTDVVTLINKSISDNEKNNVLKDEKGFYTNNGQNSIELELVMITDEEENKTKTYKMELIYNLGVTEFIKNFNTEKFKCTKKEYHSETGKIKYIEITQQSV